MPTYKRPEDAENELHVLLLRAVPENKHGNKTVAELCRLIHVSKQAVHKWVRKGKLRPERAKQIADLSEGRVKLEEFHPYVYKD